MSKFLTYISKDGKEEKVFEALELLAAMGPVPDKGEATGTVIRLILKGRRRLWI